MVNLYSEIYQKRNWRLQDHEVPCDHINLKFIKTNSSLDFGKFNLRMDTIRTLFSKIRALFLIFKIGQGRPHPPPPLLVARLYLKYSWLKLKKNDVVNCKYKDMMKVFWSICKSEDLMKVLFLSKRHSKPALARKYYEKSGQNPKKLGEI